MDILRKNVLAALFILILLVAGGYFLYFQETSKSSISGLLDVNGVVPQGASVSIMAQKSGDTDFSVVISSLAAVDKTSWDWQGATKGMAYTIKAVLFSEGKTISESAPLTVVAPAAEEVLRLNSTYSPLKPSYTTISGSINLNGAVTTASSISLYQKKIGEQEYALVTAAIPAQDGASWSWGEAVAGTTYDVKAVLTVNGSYGGESQIVVVTAPAANEVMTINSHYAPLPEKATISGTLNINGQFPPNTTMSLFKQGPGDSSYVQIGSNISAVDGTSWSWNGATQGGQYNLQAIAYLNGANIAQSQIITVAAPAAGETLTINAGVPTGQPPNSPTVQCVSQAGNTWTVNVNYQAVSGANRYWLQVGTQPKGNDVVNYFANATGQSTMTYTFSSINSGTTYFAQYATSTCSSCSQASAFSSFSNLLQFACFPATATPTPTPYPPQPTYTPYPTPTAYPTNNPTPTFTPTPTLPPLTSGCNGSCGGSGYQCATGLECSVSGLIGGNVCRNPNCTAETDCTCK